MANLSGNEGPKGINSPTIADSAQAGAGNIKGGATVTASGPKVARPLVSGSTGG